jgi:hypothetical protein
VPADNREHKVGGYAGRRGHPTKSIDGGFPKFKSALAGLALAAAVPAAHASTVFQIVCIAPFNNANCPAVATQMTMTLSDQGSGSTLLRFENTGPTASTITAIYLQIGGLLSSLAFQSDSGAGVDMSVTATPTPASLPGGRSLTPPFVKTTGAFHADRNSNRANGIDPGEFLQLLGTRSSGTSHAQLVAAFVTPNANGVARAGLHVQGIGPADGSDAMISIVPAALPLLASGLLALGWMARRRGA